MVTNHIVLVSKRFDNATIHYRIKRVANGQGEMEFEMSLDDFIDALGVACQHPSGVFTRKQLKAALRAASAEVTQEMKNASVHLPPSVPPTS